MKKFSQEVFTDLDSGDDLQIVHPQIKMFELHTDSIWRDGKSDWIGGTAKLRM